MGSFLSMLSCSSVISFLPESKKKQKTKPIIIYRNVVTETFLDSTAKNLLFSGRTVDKGYLNGARRMSATSLLDAGDDGNTQMKYRGEDVIDLRLGQPDPSLLPVEMIGKAAAKLMLAAEGSAEERFGVQSLCYGSAIGPHYLISWIEDHVNIIEPEAELSKGETLVSAGNSDAVDQLCTNYSQ